VGPVFYDRKGLAIMALSGVDLALWDICGKAAGEPVYSFCGARPNRRFRLTTQVDLGEGLIYVNGRVTKNKHPKTAPIYGDMKPWLDMLLSRGAVESPKGVPGQVVPGAGLEPALALRRKGF
jgi:hypothetical protein